MGKQLFIAVSTPCQENWDAMTATDKGRFCAQCQKQVVDFTNMSDRQLADFLKKPSTGSLCGRLSADQLERGIEVPPKRIPWINYFIQFTLPAFLLSLKPIQASAQVKQEGKTVSNTFQAPQQDTLTLPEVVVTSAIVSVPKQLSGHPGGNNATLDLSNALTGKIGCMVSVYQPPVCIDKVRDLRVTGMGQRIFTARDTGMRKIEGLVLEADGNLMYGIAVRIKGTRTGTLSDANGRFSLMVRPGDVLIASGVGCEAAEKTVAVTDTFITFGMRRLMMGVISVKKIKRKKKDAAPVLPSRRYVTQKNVFQLLPNCTSAGQTVAIQCNTCETGKYQVQVLNMNGQPVHQQIIELLSGQSNRELVLPTIPAGYYFVNLKNVLTKKINYANLLIL